MPNGPNPDQTTDQTPTKYSGRRLSLQQRQEIFKLLQQGLSQTVVAKQFDVNRNTIQNLVKSIRQSPAGPSLDVRPSRDLVRDQVASMRDQITDQSYAAVQRSVSDAEQVHAAAATALNWLKASGSLTPDCSSVQVFINQVVSLPEHLRGEFVSDDDVVTIDSRDVTDQRESQ